MKLSIMRAHPRSAARPSVRRFAYRATTPADTPPSRKSRVPLPFVAARLRMHPPPRRSLVRRALATELLDRPIGSQQRASIRYRETIFCPFSPARATSHAAAQQQFNASQPNRNLKVAHTVHTHTHAHAHIRIQWSFHGESCAEKSVYVTYVEMENNLLT